MAISRLIALKILQVHLEASQYTRSGGRKECVVQLYQRSNAKAPELGIQKPALGPCTNGVSFTPRLATSMNSSCLISNACKKRETPLAANSSASIHSDIESRNSRIRSSTKRAVKPPLAVGRNLPPCSALARSDNTGRKCYRDTGI